VLPYGLPSSINGRIPGNDITFIKRNSDASVTNACAIVHSAASVILTRCNFGHHSERNNATRISTLLSRSLSSVQFFRWSIQRKRAWGVL